VAAACGDVTVTISAATREGLTDLLAYLRRLLP
jgi:hypothetical protein